MEPCRLFDTRGNEGPPIEGLSERRIPTVSRCEIPTTAKALAVNVTVTDVTEGGDLRLFAEGVSLPAASTINYLPGQTRANNAIVSLGAAGGFMAHSDQQAGTVHLLVDVTGYFE